MESMAVDLKLGMAKHQKGDIAGAEQVYRSILAETPDHAGAWHMLGLVSFAKRQYELAKTQIQRALEVCDTKAVYWNNLGAVLRELGQIEEALGVFEQALAIGARYPDALSNRALCLSDLGRKEEAYRAFQETLAVDANRRDAMRNLAKVCLGLSRTEEALDWYKRCLDIDPQDAEILCALGDLSMSQKDFAAAADAFEQAARVEPGNERILLALGRARAEQGDVAQAKDAFAEAARLRPDRASWRFRPLGYWPPVFDDEEAVTQQFAALDRDLGEAKRGGFEFDWRRCLEDGFCPPFGLTHYGRCCRTLKERYSELFAPHFPQRRPSFELGERLRIGFLITAGQEQGFLRDMSHIVARLDPVRFEAVVVCARSGMDHCRKRMQTPHVAWVGYPDDFEGAVATIRAARCHILYHRQVGTVVDNYFLPFARLAPIQCTGWATHGTSGVPHVDYYISSDLMEYEGSETQYTERVFKLHNTFPTFQARIARPPACSRDDFGLPARGAIYLCPQRIEKLGPTFDSFLRGVLETDTSGTVLMLKGRHPGAFEHLAARLRRTLGKASDRVAYAPNLPPRDYYRLFSLADVILDAPHYSTSLTGFDACSFGIPIVTLPGPRKVERYAQGIYRKIGIKGLTVASESDYVGTAVRLGTDEELRRHYRKEIMEKSEALFEDEESVREHERFFEYAWGQREALGE